VGLFSVYQGMNAGGWWCLFSQPLGGRYSPGGRYKMHDVGCRESQQDQSAGILVQGKSVG